MITPVTIPWIQSQKKKQKITMLTAYDFPTAVLLDEAGIDLLLVGDSLGMVLYGEKNTLSVTVEDIIRHTQAVQRGTKRSMVISDMPFLSYQVSIEKAVENAGRLMKEGKTQAVKLEGGTEIRKTIQTLVQCGIPVMGHIGLLPQSIHSIGKFRMFGSSSTERNYLLESAQSLQDAGAFSIVLECIEPSLAEEITSKLEIPTFGIGSGPDCDGAVLVTYDLVGLTVGHIPRFVAPLEQLKVPFKQAIINFIQRTRTPL